MRGNASPQLTCSCLVCPCLLGLLQGFYNPYATPQSPQLYAGPAATMYPHAQVSQGASGYPASPGYMQGPHIVQYSSPGLVATMTALSKYGTAASTQNPGQSSGTFHSHIYVKYYSHFQFQWVLGYSWLLKYLFF